MSLTHFPPDPAMPDTPGPPAATLFVPLKESLGTGRRRNYFETFSRSESPRLAELIALQRGVVGGSLHLIASACYPFDSVLRAHAEPSFVLPAEGMPGARYLPGAKVMDLVEEAGEELTLDLFGHPDGYRATIQPHSGTQANQIVYNAALGPDDTVLCLRPRDGGHISHSVVLSRRNRTVSYTLTADGMIDYESMRAQALLHRPRLIIVGGSALPRAIDFGLCATIAEECGALLHGDVSHTATFVAAGLHMSVLPYCDFVSFNTVKNLRGPNGGVLLYRDTMVESVHRSIFPTTQGGANETGMFGKLACLLEWKERDIASYARSILTAARTLGDRLESRGITLVTGGTDCHLLLLDLSDCAHSGALIERQLESFGVLANRNLVPSDARSPSETSGLRLGATNLAILGYESADLELLGDWLADAIYGDTPSTTVIPELIDKYQRHLMAPVW